MTLGHFPPLGPAASVAPLPPVPAPIAPEGPREESEDASTPLVETLTLIHAVGVDDNVVSELRSLRLDAAVPLAEVARTGRPIFLNSGTELRRYPGWCDAVLNAGGCASAAVPVWANGQLRGVLGLTWDTPHLFDQDERAFVLTLGVMCAQAIMRGHLAASERRAREIAEQAIRKQGQFLRTMSHELRTPLNAVIGYMQLLSEEIGGRVTTVQKDHLRRARRASEHVLSLVEELLRFARLDAGERSRT